MTLKLLPTLVLCLLAMSMGFLRKDKQLPETLPIPTPEVTVPGASVPKPKVFLTLGKCSNCSAKELGFIKSAEIKANEVVGGSCFRKEMMAMSLVQTEGRTPEQVVNSLVGVQVDTEMYYTIKRVLGYTLPNVPKIWINRKYMMSWSVCDLGSLLSHESSHKLGYEHDFKLTKRRPQSVPYSINRAFKACCVK